MKRIAFLFALAPCLAPAQDDKSGTLRGTLKFANQNILDGTPVQIESNEFLHWKSDLWAESIDTTPFRLSKILELRLAGGEIPKLSADHQALLTLNNKDTIRGELDALDDTHVTLNTWYGGPLRIRRSMCSDLEIMRSERAIYTGPNDFGSWQLDGDPDSWQLQAGALLSNKAGGIAREIDMPEKCQIGFDLNWRNSLRFRILFFSDDGTTSQPENCYDLVCQRNFVYLRKRWLTGGSRIVGQDNVQELTEKEKVRLDFYLDRKTGTIALYVDGQQSHVWSDPEPNVGDFGNWLHFISDDFYPVQISRIRVSPWKGELPENADGEIQEEPLEEEGQVIRLQNGDSVPGKIGQITAGVLDIETKHCDMKIPVDRIRSVNLSSGEYEEPKRMNGDVRAWLKEGGQITFRLDSFTENTIKGYSQTFGDVEFKLDAFSRLEFNIWELEFEAMRGGPDNW